MMPPAQPADEAERVRILRELRILDTAPEPAFDAIARLASLNTGCPIAGLGLADTERVWFKASVGLAVSEFPQSSAFFADALLPGGVTVVGDAHACASLAHDPLATAAPHIRFYAAAAIMVEGQRIGAVFCVDHVARQLDEAALNGLRDLAEVAGTLLQGRLDKRRSSADGECLSVTDSQLASRDVTAELRLRDSAQQANDDDGQPTHPVDVLNDVTSQPQAVQTAERSLALSEERLTFAIEGGGQGVWDWDERESDLFLTDSWKTILGYSMHEVGSTLEQWFSGIHPEDLPEAKAQLIAHLRGETQVYAVEHRVRHKNGHYIRVLNRGKVVRRSAEGRAERMVGTVIDVTAQRQAEAVLRDKQAAELASRAKSEFLSRMSHEMRTPLNAVIGFSQLLLDRPGELGVHQVREYADHVLRAGKQLLALINDVLNLQRVEEGSLALATTDVSLAASVARVIDLLSPMAEQRGVIFDNHLASGWHVRADEHHLRQLLLNIASNAVKYNRPGGVVRWSAETGALPERVLLSIEDSGAGFRPEQLDRLFQPFDRLGMESSAIEGIGLGLVIARSLAVAMGGSLELTSRAGEGTRVLLDLPRGHANSGSSHETPTMPAETAARPWPLRMLYVEDNRINAILFEEALRLREGIELRVAEDAAQALVQVSDWQPDVLVLDAHLPGMNGFELLNALRAMPGLDGATAFMCSADAMPDDLQRAAEAGFAGYWSKPIHIAKIMSDLDRVQAGLQARRASSAPEPATGDSR